MDVLIRFLKYQGYKNAAMERIIIEQQKLLEEAPDRWIEREWKERCKSLKEESKRIIKATPGH